MGDAFFTQIDDRRFDTQEHARGPWSPDHCHAGPPAALLGGAMQAAVGGQFMARITFEILRPVEITALTVETSVPRPGRRVALVEGLLLDDDGPVVQARGWSISTEDVPLPEHACPPNEPPPSPAQFEPRPFFEVPWDVGYHTSVEMRFVYGGFQEPGPAFGWLRPTVELVAGRRLTPLERVLVGADSGNGLSALLNPREWLFINTDLTVHLHREPSSSWVGYDAATTLEPTGVGLATTTIVDEQGQLGRGLQSLLVRPHS